MRTLARVLAVGVFLGFPLSLAAAPAPPRHVDWIGALEIEGRRDVVRLYFAPDEPWARLSSRPEAYLYLEDAVFGPGSTLSFRLRADGDLLDFEGRAEEARVAGAVRRGDRTGTFEVVPVVELSPARFDEYATTFAGPRERVRLFLRDENVFFYLEGDRTVRLYPTSETTFLSEDDEALTVSSPGRATFLPHGQPAETWDRAALLAKEDVTFSNGDVELSGTLLLPASPGPHPALVFVHGSRTNERSWYCAEAFPFTKRGFAALVFDKRGSGRSGGVTETASLHDLADDAIAGVRFLRARDDVLASKVGVWGLSQGATIASVAASRSRDVAFVVSVSGVGGTFVQQELFNTDNKFRHAGFSDRLRDTGLRFWKMTTDLPVAVKDGRLPDVFGIRDALGMDVPLDRVWEKVSQPALVVYGEKDSLVPAVESAAAIRAALEKGGNRDYAIHLFPDASHGLALTRTGSRTERENVRAPGFTALATAWALRQVEASTGLPPTGTEVSGARLRPSGDYGKGGRFGPVSRYGSAPVQLALGLAFTLTALSALVGFWFRERDSGNLLALASGLATLVMVGGFAVLGVLVLFPDFPRAAPGWVHVLPIAGLAAAVLAIAQVVVTVRGAVAKRWGTKARLFYTWIAAVNVAFVGWLSYWRLLGTGF